MRGILIWLKTNPTYVVQGVQVLLGLAVAFDLIGFTDAQTGAILAIVAAVTALINGLFVRPFQWLVVTGVVQAAFTLLAEFGFSFTETQVAGVYSFFAFLGLVITRQIVTPETKFPAIQPTPAGASRDL